jgi:hypothetical protein
MNRRVFIRSVAMTTAVCAGGAEVGANVAGEPMMLTLYDPRFAQSQAFASQLAPSGRLRPVGGDVSELVPLMHSPHTAFNVSGVTTESVPFCLEQLLNACQRPARVEMRRLDADLFAWTLRSA